MNQAKILNIKKRLRSKETKAIKVMIGFLLLALAVTYLSRFASSIITPQVECETPNSGSISHKIYTTGTIEKEYKMNVVVSLSEYSFIKEGDIAEVYSYDLNEEVEAKVLSIKQDIANPSDYNVTLTVPEDGFTVGLTTDVVFEKVSQKYDFILPWSAIRSGADNSCYVLVVDTENTILGETMVAKRVGIKIEDSNESECGVSSNSLTENDSVIIISDKNVEAGDAIRFKED